MAIINRTLAAFVIAIVAVEYVLRWLPQGAHHWCKIVKPVEVTAGLGEQFSLVHRTGVRVNPLDRSLRYTGYEGVNYMLLLQKSPGVNLCRLGDSRQSGFHPFWVPSR